MDAILSQQLSDNAPVMMLATFAAALFPWPGFFSSCLIASGYVYGPHLGFLLAWPAATAGACAAFGIGRRYGERLRSSGWVPPKVIDVCDAVSDGGLPTLCLIRLTPMPVALSSMALGSIPSISDSHHAIATAVGFVRLLAHVFVGHTLADAASSSAGSRVKRLATVGGAVLLCLSIGNIARLALNKAARAKRKGAASS